jgi:hypothetical protein
MTTLKSATLAQVSAFAAVSTGSLASNSNALSGTLDPTGTNFGGSGTTPGYQRARFVFTGTFAAAPTANTSIALFARLPADGTLTGTPTTYETDLGRSATPVRAPLAVIPLDSTNTAQARVSEAVDIPAVPFEVIAVNNGTGQTISAGWSLSLVPVTDVGV